jgi:hypothetical protein
MAEGQVTQTPQPSTEGGQGAQATPQAPQVADPNEFLNKTGFKSLDDAAKTLKEQHATITRLSQERKQYEQALQAMYQKPSATQEPTPSKGGQGTDFFDDPEGTVAKIADQIAERRVRETVQQLEAKQIIDRVKGENPARFEALRPIAQQIYVERPYLNTLGEEGLRQAMQEAENRRAQYLADLKAEQFPEQANDSGVSADLKEQAKAEVLSDMQRAQAATIPQGGVSRPISDDIRQKMKEAQSKGDIDALLDMKFSKIKT